MIKAENQGTLTAECYTSAEAVYDAVCDQVATALKKHGFTNIEDGESVTGSKRVKIGEQFPLTIKIPINITVVAEVEYEED